MKVPTLVFLSEELLAVLDNRAPDLEHRSDLIDAALKFYLLRQRRRDFSRDLEIINTHAGELNEEAEDVLSYQVMA